MSILVIYAYLDMELMINSDDNIDLKNYFRNWSRVKMKIFILAVLIIYIMSESWTRCGNEVDTVEMWRVGES